MIISPYLIKTSFKRHVSILYTSKMPSVILSTNLFTFFPPIQLISIDLIPDLIPYNLADYFGRFPFTYLYLYSCIPALNLNLNLKLKWTFNFNS